MTHTEKYARMVFPDRVLVLGVELQAATIGHGLLLARIKSPFWGGGAAGTGRICQALWVLSRPCKEAAEGLQSGRADKVLRGWARQLGRARQSEVEAARAGLARWIDSSFEALPLWDKQETDGEKKMMGAPVLLILATRLMHTLQVPWREVMDYPIARARWELACHAEEQGGLEWVNERAAAAIAGEAAHGE